MKFLAYYLAYSLLWLVTLLPLKVIYGLSDFLFLLLYYLARYRRKTVFRNLRLSLPDLPDKEIRRIARKFYRQLCDYFLEWMYQIHMSGTELEKRMRYKNPEVLVEYFRQGKSIVLLMSHYGNWEWQSGIARLPGHKVLAIYKPLQNRYFNKLFLDLRSKFGVVGVPMESAMRSLMRHHQDGEPILLLALADQRPQWKSIQQWARFLNQDTPIITGPEKIARRFNHTVLSLEVTRLKRGYYEAEFRTILDNPKKDPGYPVMLDYLKGLEGRILQRPELWLWSHKRWKYRREQATSPVDYGKETPRS